MKCILLASL